MSSIGVEPDEESSVIGHLIDAHLVVNGGEGLSIGKGSLASVEALDTVDWTWATGPNKTVVLVDVQLGEDISGDSGGVLIIDKLESGTVGWQRGWRMNSQRGGERTSS